MVSEETIALIVQTKAGTSSRTVSPESRNKNNAGGVIPTLIRYTTRQMKSIRDILPRISQSTLDANPQLSATMTLLANKTQELGQLGGKKRKHRGEMNATESEFSRGLEAQRRQGKILRYVFEGFTLRWADMRYTPDFLVFREAEKGYSHLDVQLIEVKGAHIWDRDIVTVQGRSSILAGVQL